MKYQRVTLGILSLTVLSLACSLLTTPVPSPADGGPPAPVDPPNVPPATDAPPQLPPTQNLPAGLVTATENTLILFDSNGTELSRIAFPQLTFGDRSRVHIAGTMPASGGTVPILYFSFDTTESLLFRDGSGQIFSLLNGSGFLGLAGAAGQPIVAFSEIEYLDVTLRSKIYVGSIQTLPSAAPISVIDDPESWAIRPIKVQVDNGTPTRVWYTRMAFGIGGDIVFEPRKGLFLLDIPSGQANTILNNDVSPWDISNDQNWIAYSASNSQAEPMCVKNLGTGAELCFPALPASEPRGSGDGFFSPDAQYLAWMEGEGWQMAEVPTFKSTVRIGQNNGVIVADLPMKTFESVANIGSISRAEPVGWLDAQTVVIQVRGDDWDRVSLLRYNVVSRQNTYLAPGEFVGFLYP